MMSNKTNIFIEKAKNVFGNRYEYNEVEYIKNDIKVNIGCKIHGVFDVSPANHLRGNGCAKCSKKHKKTTEDFIIDAINVFGLQYDYSEVVYVNSRSKVIIICEKHGKFLISANSHLTGKSGCRLCGIESIKLKRRFTTQEFIDKSKEIHKNAKYDYTQTIYINNKIIVKINCEEHGDFFVIPNNHIRNKQGCSKCVFKKRYSKNSIEWLNFISKLYNIEIQHGENSVEYRIPTTRFSADGYCKETNTIYEFHGDYWHGNPNVYNLNNFNKTKKISFGELYQRTIDKEQLIKDSGYNLITIWENDWKKLNRYVKILQRKYRNSKL